MQIYSMYFISIHGKWEAMDAPEGWRKKVKDPDRDYEVDLVETFFTGLELR